MRAIDTNVLVRLIARDEAAQTASAEAAVAKGAWVSHLVLAETVWVLASAYGLSAKQIALAVEMLLNHAQITIQDADVVSRALGHHRAHPKVELSDCLVLEIACKHGHAPLSTFDRRFSEIDGVERI
ncbi:MAG: PIN domain-containing protein [Pseudomonadota bacterium]